MASRASGASVHPSEQLEYMLECAHAAARPASDYAADYNLLSVGPSAAAEPTVVGPTAAQPRLRPPSVLPVVHPVKVAITHSNVTMQRKPSPYSSPLPLFFLPPTHSFFLLLPSTFDRGSGGRGLEPPAPPQEPG